MSRTRAVGIGCHHSSHRSIHLPILHMAAALAAIVVKRASKCIAVLRYMSQCLRTVRTGTLLYLTTYSATLPINRWASPERP